MVSEKNICRFQFISLCYMAAGKPYKLLVITLSSYEFNNSIRYKNMNVMFQPLNYSHSYKVKKKVSNIPTLQQQTLFRTITIYQHWDYPYKYLFVLSFRSSSWPSSLSYSLNLMVITYLKLNCNLNEATDGKCFHSENTYSRKCIKANIVTQILMENCFYLTSVIYSINSHLEENS